MAHPALYINDCMEVIKHLPPHALFHSEFLMNKGCAPQVLRLYCAGLSNGINPSSGTYFRM
jgi:hypothetical protein